MLGTFSFECPEGHVEDRFIHRSDRDSQKCGICGAAMHQIIRHAPKLDWLSLGAQKNAGPEFIDRFEKMHKDRKAHEERKEAEHGDYGTMAGA